MNSMFAAFLIPCPKPMSEPKGNHPVVRSGLAIILELAAGIETVAEASTGTEAL